MKGIFKFILFSGLMALFLIHHTLVSLFIWNEKLKLKYYLQSISLTSKLALKVLNVRVYYEGQRGEVNQKLLVANHLSYLDVLILFAEYPSLFITSTEIRDTFLLGRICKLAGCFFVERRKDRHTSTTKTFELNMMKEKLAAGFNVFLFPEGTSSDGSNVLPFKGTFFQMAVDADIDVQPLCLKYTGENRDVPPWYGDMTFPDHLFKLCQQNEIKAKVISLPALRGTTKMQLASDSYASVSGAYGAN